jgi:hypothetical protein
MICHALGMGMMAHLNRAVSFNAHFLRLTLLASDASL